MSLGDDHEPHPATVARTGVEHLVHQVLREAHGPDAVASREIWKGSSTTLPAPADYRQGIHAARTVRDAVWGLIDSYVRKARGDGMRWRELADALDVADEDDPALAAFQKAAPEPLQPFDEISIGWKCATCGKWVTDVAPYGHPVDCERGHAEDCARHLTEIQAYEGDH